MKPSNLLKSIAARSDDPRGDVTIALLVVAVCLLMIGGRHLWQAQSPIEFAINLATSTNGAGQVFANTPAGYTEAASVKFALSGDGAPHRYETRITGMRVPDRIRFDPGVGSGNMEIRSIEIATGNARKELSGPELQAAIRPLNQLRVEGPSVEGVRMRSTGDDPFFEFPVPDEVRKSQDRTRRLGMLLFLAGALGMAALLLTSFGRVRRVVRQVLDRGGVALFVAVVALAATLLALQGFGCGTALCSGRGLGYGAALVLASLCLAAVGAAVMQFAGMVDRRSGPPRLFLCIAVGQVAVLLYVFLRSALHAAIPYLPVSAPELFVIVGLAVAYLGKGGRALLPAMKLKRECAWVAIELALLVAVCIVIADRELPRTLMLSSDPDTHAYLARQVELLGAVPWHGERVFGYPAGSAALAFIWAKLSLLDVRNALTALPLLQTLFAALMLGEALAVRVRSLAARLLIQATVLSVTAAGFLIPLFSNYSHMEGAGRQVAIVFFAIVPAMIMAAPRRHLADDLRLSLLATASLFALAVLNPVNIVVPCILLGAYACHVAIARRRASWLLLALVACPALLLLDPYYFALMSGSGESVVKIGVTEAFQLKSSGEVIADWVRHHVERPWQFVAGFWTMSSRHKVPLFAIFLVLLMGLYVAISRRYRPGWPLAAAVLAALIGLVAADGLFSALADDRRFYLLHPYFALNVLQHKVLLITTLAAAVVWIGWLRKLRFELLVAMAGMVTLIVAVGMRREQAFVLQPRVNYCGSLGCVADSDIEVMRRFEDLVRKDHLDAASRVLVPNSVHDTRNEFWVFPVSGARALPFFDVLPVAFFYYQGDDDYTTANYMAHVCKRFDRAWLKAERIDYVFLPADRAAACIHSLESLPASEEVILNVGNSYLLRLR